MAQHGVRLRVWGPTACFARPEMKVEAVSYDVMTPSAARGIVEAIYWKPEIRWVITAIHVLSPIRFMSLRTNGVASKIPAKGAVGSAMKKGSGAIALYADEDRQQFAAQVLRDVHYIIEARFETLSGSDNAGKHLGMFQRRADSGQCFHRPYLGRREHEAFFAWVDPETTVPAPSEPLPADWTTEPYPVIAQADRASLSGERDLGYMLWDIDHPSDRTPHFFKAVLRDGVIRDIDQERRLA
ncbi:type I-C CRISPR-associated protein Cas5c [Mucisphaera calidilacus]|uniref:pre-crRNA processing endonuclease n=1 Tax=Mucisphaera calidilacus TaxID=2527982 RepID=A0A518C073_9BACT|nr:type I-C CRISPR-associated protein Cas5c [Mucisphaera calidilacus]QDU72626.1 CRISPR-associated protein Cas5 [Mucisphaera calidilacus]